MCGRFNISDDPLTRMLCEQLGLFDQQANLRFSEDIPPASTISIIKQNPPVEGKRGQRTIEDAIWWLLLEKDQTEFKANYKYASFNSRSDKLNSPRAIAYHPYRESRCIIPASSFVEGQDKRYHQLQAVDSAIAFGGLYKTWINENSGEVIHSASIITLPGNPKLEHIHRKSVPLMLPLDNTRLIDAWLEPSFSKVEKFEPFLQPILRQPFLATPVDKPSKRNPIGLVEQIPADL
ncbi:MAG: putative SOS response-associated peptidase YedK [Phenylobacterium sp.]|jgi:putative SOS response-associated peptidase YedK